MDENVKQSTALLATELQDFHYFNGFSLGIGTGDVFITLTLHGRPTLTLNASYTVAKTLANALTAAILRLEEKTSHTIMTVQEVNEAMKKP